MAGVHEPLSKILAQRPFFSPWGTKTTLAALRAHTGIRTLVDAGARRAIAPVLHVAA